ncbi:Ras-related protein Rab-7a [Linum grandiflorum]
MQKPPPPTTPVEMVLKSKNEHHYKLVVLGSSNSGKTSWIRALQNQDFIEAYEPTTSHNICEYVIQTGDDSTHFQIWDIPGHMVGAPLVDLIGDADCCVLCFDPAIGLERNNDNIGFWKRELGYLRPGIPVVGLASKLDLFEHVYDLSESDDPFEHAYDLSLRRTLARNYNIRVRDMSAIYSPPTAIFWPIGELARMLRLLREAKSRGKRIRKRLHWCNIPTQ